MKSKPPSGFDPTKSTLQERKQFGKDLRKKNPREDHATWHKTDEQRAMLSIIRTANRGRIHDLIPIRYGRMLASPFAFYRGTAALMAYDLNSLPRSQFEIQICGDCHIMNFGAFNTPERNVIVDINDFDETTKGPWEWDVKRLAASFVLAAGSMNLPDAVGKEAALVMTQSYKNAIASYAEMTFLDVWYAKIPYDDFIAADRNQRHSTDRALQKEENKSSPEMMLSKYTELQNGSRKFKNMPPLVYHVDKDEIQIAKYAYSSYIKTLPEERRVLLERYDIVDIARKVVGIGSVGTLCAVLLMEASERDFLILQVKEARRSALEPYVHKSPYTLQGQRIVVGQRIMQSASDIFLGWTSAKNQSRQLFIRQLRDVKLSLVPQNWDRARLMAIAQFTGKVLAKAHARSGDAAVLTGYIGKSDVFEKAIAKFSVAYANQTELDFVEFSKACKSGKLKAIKVDT